MSGAPSVRLARVGDADRIATLLGQLSYPTTTDAVRVRLERLLPRDDLRVVVADNDGVVQGVLALFRMATLTDEVDIAWIVALVVDEGARGSGIGRLLLGRAEEVAKGWGCRRIAVTSAERRVDAHAFYLAVGYPYTGRRFVKALE